MILKPAPGKQVKIARLDMLPQGRSRWSSMGASMAVQAVILGIVLLIPLIMPPSMLPKVVFNLTPLQTPLTEVPVAPPPKPPVVHAKATPAPPPPPVEEAVAPEVIRQPKILAPHVEAPKVQPKIAKVEAPKVETTFDTPKVEIENNMALPNRPRAPVQTGLMSSGSAAPATITKDIPLEKVQTGGFGDPNGVAGPANPNKGANVNGRGSPALPPGPGYGNGTGGANGARGTVQSTGFGNGTAIPPSGNGGARHPGTVQSGGFAAAVVESDAPKSQTQAAAAVQPIEILDKPRPQYTQEARDLKIEGDVVLQVVFKANGEVQVLGVAQSLGHGLDEMAMKAAKSIKYKPAISNGQAVDFPARVHIEFQLAY
jgi:TonB family protein